MRDTKLMVGIIVNILYTLIASGILPAIQLNRIRGLNTLILSVEGTIHISSFNFHENMTRDDISRDNAEIR